jgi:hypothetical protein
MIEIEEDSWRLSDAEVERMKAQGDDYMNGEDKGPRQRAIYDSKI